MVQETPVPRSGGSAPSVRVSFDVGSNGSPGRPGSGPMEELEIKSAEFSTVKPSELRVVGWLGSGAQADVFKAEWTRSFAASTSSIMVAVKRVHANLDATTRHREAMGISLDHLNIVKCFDFTVDPPYLIVTEFCAGGTVADLIYSSGIKLSLLQQVKILLDVATGMNYMHSQEPRILHRDLKSSNVLLTKQIESDEQAVCAKVGDFGLSRDSTSNSCPMTGGVGTWRWMAPEVLDFDEGTSYNEMVDVFSFGMLMYEVMAQKLPYSDDYPSDVTDPRMGVEICMGMRPKVDDELSHRSPVELQALMKRAWDGDPDARPTFAELEQELLQLYDSMAR